LNGLESEKPSFFTLYLADLPRFLGLADAVSEDPPKLKNGSFSAPVSVSGIPKRLNKPSPDGAYVLPS